MQLVLGVLERLKGKPLRVVHIYALVMWMNAFKASAGFFVLCLAGVALYDKWRTGSVDWKVVLIAAIAGMVVGIVRYIRPYLRQLRPLFFRTELARLRQRRRMTQAAVDELIASMVKLSPGDFSIYQTVLGISGPDNAPGVLTSQGSPNHHVLVQMADLGITKPEQFNTIGEPPHTFTSVRYVVTPGGRNYIGKLLPYVMQLREQNATRPPQAW